jgi:hypothetical protein
MKHLFTTLSLLVIAAIGAGFVSFRLGGETSVRDALEKRDALEWLRTDFRLNEAQFAAIRKLHESYSVVCEEHCRAIQDAAAARDAVKKTPSTDARAVAEAERRVQELRAVCETAIAAHVRQVATEMSPAEGQRYLALVLPKIADFDHRAAPDLGLSAHRH